MEVIERATLIRLYETMVTIRSFEERLAQDMAAGKPIRAGHSAVGQEAISSGICVHLKEGDYVATTHRGHAQCIAKGVDPRVVMAELGGKATGCCKGKGGSMHVADLDQGMLGAYPVVGSNMPLACGPALTAKVKGTDNVSVVFFGDGAANQGTFHESMNLASIWKLPVIFVCENNRYAQSTPVEYASSIKNIADRAAGYSVPGLTIDGQDVFAVYEAAGQFIKRAREGKGPSLLECKTYRYSGHYVGDNDLRYRTKQEVDFYKGRDCIETFKKRVLELKLLDAKTMEDIQTKARNTMDEAARFTEESPFPSLDELTTDVYVSYP